jgi:outer membrane protein assembly factor BamA
MISCLYSIFSSTKLIFLYFFLLLWCPSFLLSQDSLSIPLSPTSIIDSSFIIEKIILVGNSHTKDFVILREMMLKPGSAFSQEMMEYDKNRIYSLGLFNQVLMHVRLSSQRKILLVVEVSERWYIFPYPIFGIRDRDWNKLYYGVGIRHNNFRGRNEKIIGSFILGHDPSIALAYRNPFLSEEGTYFLDGRIAFNKIRNKSLRALNEPNNFDEQHFSVFLTIGKRFGISHTVWIGAGYEIIDIAEYLSLKTFSPDGKDKYPVLGIGYVYDTRDLLEYPSYGTLARAAITKFGIPPSDVDIVRYAVDLRRYIPINSDIVLTTRMFADLAAAGPTPSYNRVFFGYDERIRGHFNEIMEGESIVGLSSELHYALLTPRYFKINFLPQAFGIWKFGVIAAAFADAGTVYFRSEPFALNGVRKGYGVGIHFLLPYSMVVCTEYAWNELRRGQFIFDVGTTF